MHTLVKVLRPFGAKVLAAVCLVAFVLVGPMAAVDSLSFVGGACACGGGGDSSGSSSDGGGGDSQGASGASDATTPPLGFSPTENLKGFSARSTDSGTSSTNTQDVINQVNTIGATPGQALGGVGISQSPPPSVKFFKEHKNKATWENRFAVQFRNFTLWPFRLWPFTIRPFQLLTISTPWLALNLSLTQAEFAKSFQLAKAIQEYGRIGAVTFFTNPNNVSKVQADLGLSRLGSSPGSSGGSSSGQSIGSPGSGSESSGGGTSGGGGGGDGGGGSGGPPGPGSSGGKDNDATARGKGKAGSQGKAKSAAPTAADVAKSLLGQAEVAMSKAQYALAVELYSKALALTPKDPTIPYNLKAAKRFLEQKRPEHLSHLENMRDALASTPPTRSASGKGNKSRSSPSVSKPSPIAEKAQAEKAQIARAKIARAAWHAFMLMDVLGSFEKEDEDDDHQLLGTSPSSFMLTLMQMHNILEHDKDGYFSSILASRYYSYNSEKGDTKTRAALFRVVMSLQSMQVTPYGEVEVGRQGASRQVSKAQYDLANSIRTGARSQARVALPDQTVLTMGQNTTVNINKTPANKTTPAVVANKVLNVIKGVMRYTSKVAKRTKARVKKALRRQFTIRTPTGGGAVRGTDFLTAVADDGATTWSVIDGEVEVTADKDGAMVVLGPGEQVRVSAAGKMGPVSRIGIAAMEHRWREESEKETGLTPPTSSARKDPAMAEKVWSFPAGDIPWDMGLVISASILGMRGDGALKDIHPVVMTAKTFTGLQEKEFRYEGFQLTGVSIIDYAQATVSPGAVSLRAGLEFTASHDRKAAVWLDIRYRFVSDTIVVETASARPYAPPVPRAVIAVVPATAVSEELFERHVPYETLFTRLKNAGIQARSDQAIQSGPQDYYVAAFFLDRIPSRARTEVRLSESRQGAAGHTGNAVELDYQGWRVALLPASLGLHKNETLFAKAVYLPQKAAAGNIARPQLSTVFPFSGSNIPRSESGIHSTINQ